jgi:hypothetical protein
MFLNILICLLIVYIIYVFTNKPKIIEGNTTSTSTYTDYSDNDCMILATQNQNNISSLQNQMDTVIGLSGRISQIQNILSTNSQQIQTLTDNLYNSSMTTPIDTTSS